MKICGVCHSITFDERVSVSLDTAEIQPRLRLRFKQWVLYTVHRIRKYEIWQNQLQNWILRDYSHI